MTLKLLEEIFMNISVTLGEEKDFSKTHMYKIQREIIDIFDSKFITSS